MQSTDEDWIFETKDCPWLLLEQQGDKVTMTLDPNEEIEDRETTFVLIAGEGGGVIPSLKRSASRRTAPSTSTFR